MNVAQGEEVTDKAFIFSLLKRLQNGHALLTATVRGNSHPCNTTILEISTQTPFLVLDELNDPHSHTLYQDKKNMTVKGQLEGLTVSFECQLLKTDTDEEVSKYYIAFPESVVYHQKRQSYRIHISPDLQLPVELHYDKQIIRGGLIVDISQTGLGVSIEEFIKFEPGKYIDSCNIILPKHDTIRCKVIIRHSEYDETNNITHLGVEMLDLANQERHDYLRAVAHIQREMVRRHARVQHL